MASLYGSVSIRMKRERLGEELGARQRTQAPAGMRMRCNDTAREVTRKAREPSFFHDRPKSFRCHAAPLTS